MSVIPNDIFLQNNLGLTTRPTTSGLQNSERPNNSISLRNWMQSMLTYWNISSGGGIALPNNQIVFGTGTGVSSNSDLTYDGDTLSLIGNISTSKTLTNSNDYTIATSENTFGAGIKGLSILDSTNNVGLAIVDLSGFGFSSKSIILGSTTLSGNALIINDGIISITFDTINVNTTESNLISDNNTNITSNTEDINITSTIANINIVAEEDAKFQASGSNIQKGTNYLWQQGTITSNVDTNTGINNNYVKSNTSIITNNTLGTTASSSSREPSIAYNELFDNCSISNNTITAPGAVIWDIRTGENSNVDNNQITGVGEDILIDNINQHDFDVVNGNILTGNECAIRDIRQFGFSSISNNTISGSNAAIQKVIQLSSSINGSVLSTSKTAENIVMFNSSISNLTDIGINGLTLINANLDLTGIIKDIIDNTIIVGNTKLGTNTLANSTLQVDGSLSLGYKSVTGSYVLTSTDYTLDCNGTFSVTLPTSVGCQGRIYNIKNSGSGTVTLIGNTTETIDGSNTITISTQFQNIQVQSTGANWIIL